MNKTFKKLTFVYYLMFVAMIAAVALGYYCLKNGFLIDIKSQTGITIQSIVILYIIISLPLSLYFFNKMTKKWQLIENDTEKLRPYEKWSIIRLFIVGFGIFAGIFLYYLMQSQSMLFCAGISAIGLFFCKPTKNKIISELDLNFEIT